MNRKDWRALAILAAAALVAHAAVPACWPRYEWHIFGPTNSDVLRVDRWTGEHQHAFIVNDDRRDGFTAPLPLR